MTAADDIRYYFFIVFFSEKIRLDFSCETSARQRIHMKHQALLSSTDKGKKISVVCWKFLFGALRVNIRFLLYMLSHIWSLQDSASAGFIESAPSVPTGSSNMYTWFKLQCIEGLYRYLLH